MTKPRAVATMLLYAILLAGIGLAGWHGWTRLVLPLAPLLDPASPLALALFGLLAGTAALFSPCAFPLFPAYITLYLTLDDQAAGTSRMGRSLWYGLVCGLGAIVFFLLMGVGLAGLGGALSSYLIMTKPFIALILVGAGVVILADLSLPLPKWSLMRKPLTAQPAQQRPLRRQAGCLRGCSQPRILNARKRHGTRGATHWRPSVCTWKAWSAMADRRTSHEPWRGSTGWCTQRSASRRRRRRCSTIRTR